MKWLRMLFKNHIKVFVPVDENDQPLEENGVVKFVYHLSESAVSYTAKRSNLDYIEGAVSQDVDLDVPSPAANSKNKPAQPLIEPPDLPSHGEKNTSGFPVFVFYTAEISKNTVQSG